MGLDMYLYRKNDGVEDFERAKSLDSSFWVPAHYDTNANRFVNEYGLEPGFIEVGYWRKANQIHNWFAETCGVKNCEYTPISRSQLEELKRTCETVLSSCELVDGTVHNGNRYENGEWVPILEEGRVVADPSTAIELLPTCEGFFFGGTSYDEWYVHDIEDTIRIISEALATCDDDEFYYYPSW